MMPKLKSALPFILIIAILFLIAPAQNKLTNAKDSKWFQDRMSYLASSDRVEPFLLGFSTTYANYIWIKTMLYFGSQYEKEKDYQWLASMVDIVTRLNPYFYPAYEFAGVMLPQESNNPSAALIILHRGMTHIGGERFSIPFYISWLYNNQLNDPQLAADYLTIAAHNPKAPAFYTGFAATLYYKANKKDIAIQYLMSAYYSSENPAVKETIINKLKDYDVDVSSLIQS